jgi:arginyl-tRNA synthetase
MKDAVWHLLKETLVHLVDTGAIPAVDIEGARLEVPPDRSFGDFSTNVAMVSARRARTAPAKLAGAIAKALAGREDVFSKVEVAGPGFINLFLQPSRWLEAVREIHARGALYGRTDRGAGAKVQVEFVSANPTGPLHVGHGRGAAVGDTLARILDAAGFDVQTEYYVNDVGNQMNTLGLSVLHRYRELHGVVAGFPESGYRGGYIADIARELKELRGDGLLAMDEDRAVEICREYASASIMKGIGEDLERFNVRFDTWFKESTLYEKGKVDEVLGFLAAKGLTYEEDEALWFRTTAFGDEKDRVLRKKDGSLTYFAPDIAYHKDKLERGFTKIIDIWGADHHGYVPRMKAAMAAMGADEGCFHALLIQLVSLVRGGSAVQMSTRSGEFVTLREILDEVGRDAARFFFMMRRCDAQLVFDLDLARKRSEENPVYYIQYAHARICSILRNASDQGLRPSPEKADLGALSGDDDLDLIKVLASCPDVIADAALDLEPHRVAFYLLDVASAFHRFYNRNRVISDDARVSMARLVLVDACRQVIANTLALMGVDAPESM